MAVQVAGARLQRGPAGHPAAELEQLQGEPVLLGLGKLLDVPGPLQRAQHPVGGGHRHAEVTGQAGHPDPVEVGQLLDQVEQVTGGGPGPAMLFLRGLAVTAGGPLGGGLPPGSCARDRAACCLGTVAIYIRSAPRISVRRIPLPPGLLPGGWGTQRLPRLIGTIRAGTC
jgi:hypothetical protein